MTTAALLAALMPLYFLVPMIALAVPPPPEMLVTILHLSSPPYYAHDADCEYAATNPYLKAPIYMCKVDGLILSIRIPEPMHKIPCVPHSGDVRCD